MVVMSINCTHCHNKIIPSNFLRVHYHLVSFTCQLATLPKFTRNSCDCISSYLLIPLNIIIYKKESLESQMLQ